MSIRDLRNMGLLRPERDWDERVPRSAVGGLQASGWLVVAITGCVFMVLGDGAGLTWIGLSLFAVSLIGFVRLNIKSVDSRGLK